MSLNWFKEGTSNRLETNRITGQKSMWMPTIENKLLKTFAEAQSSEIESRGICERNVRRGSLSVFLCVFCHTKKTLQVQRNSHFY